MSDTILTPVPAAAALVAVDGRTYPLEAAELLARAEGGVAYTTLVQRFANPHAEALEVLYTLPLPADGAVLGYTIRVGERVIRGEVQPREQAAEAYRTALYEGRIAGLLEQSRPDTFQQSLGNIPAGTAVEVSIDVLHPLAFLTAAGAEPPQWEWRFPTVVSVRYHGAPGRVSDAAALSPDRDADGGIPVRVSLSLALADAADAALVRSPSHALDAVAAERGVAVSFRAGERLDRDVVVRWPAATADVGVHVVEGGGLAGDDGRYALVTLVPPAAPARTWARDLTLLVDASGSMGGAPLELAKRVGGELLRSLAPADRYEIIEFASEATRRTDGFVAADARGVAAGLRALGSIRASGGTEMVAGIREAMRSARGDAQRQVVLLTDGYIGFEHEVVGQVADQANVRLHAVGVGGAPNRALTRQAARAGRGVELLVTNEADADRMAARLVAATAAPVLTGVEADGTALTGVLPAGLRDVFAGRPLLFTVELSPSGGALELRGSLAGEPWVRRIDVAAADASAARPRTDVPLGALHGRGCIEQLEAGTPDFESASRVRPRIERLAMRHRIVSSETSLVAIAEEPAVDPRQPRRRERLAVELPAGVSAEGVGLDERLGYMRPLACMIGSAPDAMARREVARMRVETPRASDRASWVGDGSGEPPSLQRVGRRRVPEAECRWLAPDRLVVELEPPATDVVLLGDEVRVEWERDGVRRTGTLRIDWPASTPRGPVPQGTRVRLVLEVPAELALGGVVQLDVIWALPGIADSEDVVGVQVAIPPRPAMPPGGGV